MEVWSGKVVQNYDSHRVNSCLTYYHIKEDKLDPKARKSVFVGLKKGEKSYKIWDPKDREFILNKDDTFDDASMMKPTDSQRVDNRQDITVGGE